MTDRRTVNSFVFDEALCTGCQACQLACTIENELPPDRSWRQIYTFNETRLPELPSFHLSLACNHCEAPACMEACPALAYQRDESTGAVLIDPDACIGCKYCSWACPFEAPRYDADAGVMSKCTLCNDRLQGGLLPACAQSCPTGALSFADLPEDQILQEGPGFPRTDLGPRIRILGLRGEGPPEMTSPEQAVAMAATRPPARKIGLRSEWSLAAFTWVAAFLFGLMTAAAAGRLDLNPLPFLALAVTAMGLATAHLGRKSRAWRAILNLRTSWLSREVASFSLFIGLGAASLAGRDLVSSATASGLAWGAAGVGFVALSCMDRVYKYLLRPGARGPHSGGVLISGLFLAAMLANAPGFAALIGLIKLGLYVARKQGFLERGMHARPLLSIARVGVGLLLPAVLWSVWPGTGRAVAILAALVGEAIDRAEFYTEVAVMTPRRQMTADLEAACRRTDSARRAAGVSEQLSVV